MLRYRLRTLLILLAVGPVVLAGLWAWGRRPSLHVPVYVIDVGSLSGGAEGLSTFRIENSGSQPVRLTCGDFVGRGRLENNSDIVMLPGEWRDIKVFWKTPSLLDNAEEGDMCIVNFTMLTSDPNRKKLEFWVFGQRQKAAPLNRP